MDKEMLQKLFSEDKEIFHGGMLLPEWICKGKKGIESRNIPQRAAVYLRLTTLGSDPNVVNLAST